MPTVDALEEDDLETILIIARNGQSGRITEREIRLLVEAYRRQMKQREAVREMVAEAQRLNLP